MTDYNFRYKFINDPIHGLIGLSELECKIIQSNLFNRLRRLQHLGLASLTFPGATHTRFSHSIGVMHIMSQMIDSLNKPTSRFKDVKPAEIDDRAKQKLRLAALLHDIGHYPLSHATEPVFFRHESEKDETGDDFEVNDREDGTTPFAIMANASTVEKVTHEQLGKAILNNSMELKEILGGEFSAKKIAQIFTKEFTERRLYSQLITSTLDCDRLDFLLRDSHYAGVSFGHTDFNFIISNLRYDFENDLFAVDYKALTSFEHYLIARYYMYNNITYHKNTMGYELMAQVLFYGMTSEEVAFGKFDDLIDLIKDKPNYFCEYDDEYFWQTLKQWKPKKDNVNFYVKLKNYILMRHKPVMLWEERKLVDLGMEQKPHFNKLNDNLLEDSKSFNKLINKFGINGEYIVLVTKKIKFESTPPHTSRYDRIDKKEESQMGRVYEGYRFKDLIDVDHSIIKILSNYSQVIRRLYFFNLDNIDLNLEQFCNLFQSDIG